MKARCLFLIFIVILITGCDYESDDNVYKINLNKEPYSVCGTDIFFSDDSYNDELDIERIIELIKEACNVDGAELAKEEISDILSDSDYTYQDILYHLQDAYNYLDK